MWVTGDLISVSNVGYITWGKCELVRKIIGGSFYLYKNFPRGSRIYGATSASFQEKCELHKEAKYTCIGKLFCFQIIFVKRNIFVKALQVRGKQIVILIFCWRINNRTLIYRTGFPHTRVFLGTFVQKYWSRLFCVCALFLSSYNYLWKL